MSTTSVGREAEALVAKHLHRHRYKVVAQNWHDRRCEIDIVATKKNVAYLVEVKYRKTNQWGDGLEAITPRKLAQMKFAAVSWVSAVDWNGDYRLMVASVSGEPPKIDDIYELD